MKFVEMALHGRCTSVRFSMQHLRTLGRPSRAGVTPARDGRPRVRGRLVGRSVGGIKCAQVHSPRRRAFQAVGSAKCVIFVSIPC